MDCLKCGKNLAPQNIRGVCRGCKIGFSELNSWCCMKDRCQSKNHKAYKDYGGRGITVCNEWVNSFPNFYRDMGDKPSPSHSLDRKDNNGSYCKDNCKWSTLSEQNSNRREYKVRKNHSTGVKGVSRIKNGKFLTQYKGKYLGTSSTIEEAESKLKSHIESLGK